MNQNTAYGNYLRTNGNRGFDWRHPAVALGAPLAGGLGAMLGGGGAAAAGGAGTVNGLAITPLASTAAMSAPSAGAGMWSLGSMINSPGFGLGVNAFSSFMNNRAQGNANKRAIEAQMRANADATALAREQMAEQMRQFNAQQLDQRAALEAQNELRRRELAASEEERAFNRRLIEEREARLAPYRANAQRWAMTLAQMLRG